MRLDDIRIGGDAGKTAADGTSLLLLSLNFLLLAFFILMNSLATEESKHAKAILARVREGYDIAGPVTDPNQGMAPVVAKAPWQEPLRAKLQGVILNRLNMRTVPLETDADSLVMELPLSTVFDGARLREPQLIRNILAAAGVEAAPRWEILGNWQDQNLLAARAAALAAQTGRAAVADGKGVLRVTFSPALTTSPDTGATLQNLGIDAGASRVEGIGHVRP